MPKTSYSEIPFFDLELKKLSAITVIIMVNPKNSLVSSIHGVEAFILPAIFSALCSVIQVRTPSLSKNKKTAYINNRTIPVRFIKG